MTPYALRLCFRDPTRTFEDYGGERATFVVMAPDVGTALLTWLERAADKGVTLHVVESAVAVTGNELPELVRAAEAGGIAAGQSYAYPPIEAAKGVFFGWIAGPDGWTELGVKAADGHAAVRAVLNAAAEEGRAVTALEDLCDLAQATDDAAFNGQSLPLAALALGMQASGTVQFGASYAERDGS